MKANNSLRINMPRALELISFFFLVHGPTYPISDLSGSAITRGNRIRKSLLLSNISSLTQWITNCGLNFCYMTSYYLFMR